MPMYGYYCSNCNHIFEMIVPMKDAEKEQPCEKCQAQASRTIDNFGSYEIKGNNSASLSPRSTVKSQTKPKN